MRQRSVDFFKILEDAAEINELAAAELSNVFMSKSKNFTSFIEKIYSLEIQQDRLCRSFTERVKKSFITPIDREDLLTIFLELKKLMKAISKTAELLDIMQITDIRPSAVKLSDFILKAGKALTAAVRELRNFKKSKKLHDEILMLGKIRKESAPHSKRAVKQLFLEERNALSLVKWKEIYDSLEEILSSMENSGKTIEIIVIKNS